jgi:carboxylate-amine ligase
MAMTEEYGLTAREQLTCGCHIHVSVDSAEEGVAVLDRIRIWLPVLSALSANSPFWHGQNTGYASYRSQVWSRWPSAGPLDILGSPEAYHQLVHDMVSTGVVLDEGMVYFDARLSRHYPTVEIRIADVCLRPQNGVLLAGIARGLVETAAREWRAGIPPVPVPTGLLRLASWKAGRWGLGGELLDPATFQPAPAVAVVNALLDYIREALEDIGDLEWVEELIDGLLAAGTGAVRQLEVIHRAGNLEAVVADAVDCTVWVEADSD